MTTAKRAYAAAGSSSSPLLLFLVVVLSSPSSARGNEHLSTTCPGGLVCHHGGSCATGDKDFSFLDGRAGFDDMPWLDATSVNGEHCVDCHEGWGGVDCSMKYLACDPDDPGTIACFNGGECYVTGIDATTGKREHMCDCRSAGSTEGDGSMRYAGKFCQHVREVECGVGTEEMFCTNGGTCALFDEYANSAHYKCECPEHRGGTHCEFLAEDGLVDCRLQCDRGTCAKGFKAYDDLVGSGSPYPAQLSFDVITSSGEHCVCPDGYTGLRCEIQVTKCGSSKYCYNGSTCAYDDDGNAMCDCSAAHTDDVSYTGAGCEQEATMRCEPGLDQDQKDAFCANHGRCIEDPATRHRGCVCEDGWSGDLCDIEVIEGVDVPVCDLPCMHGGSCRFGVKGYKDSYDSLNLPVHAKKHEDGMYCSCPDGFTGLKCEVDINHCRTDGSVSESHFCLNGVPCAPDDDTSSGNGVTDKFGCSCEDSTNAAVLPLAGRFCEFAVTEFCSKDSMRHSHSFCTNGGKCKTKNEHDDSEHHGCCCPDGYEGEYCQLPAGTLDKSRAVTWSPFSECQHEESSTSQGMFMHPNANGEWDHIMINPVFRVPPHNATTLEATTVDDSKEKSGAGGIVSGILITLLVGGLAGVAYKKRSMREDPHQFETDWWRGHVFDSEWWRGDSDNNVIDSHTNIAPHTLSRQCSYPAAHSMSEDSLEWERGYDNSDLHDIII